MALKSYSEIFAICVMSLIFGIGLTLAYQSHQTADQNRNANRADSRATDTVERIAIYCVGLEGDSRALCADDIRRTVEDELRNQRDLAAQELMARWAFWTVLTGIAGLLVTIVGIYYVRSTLIQSAETNVAALSAAQAANEANVITRMEQRPWVVLERDFDCEFMLKEHAAEIFWGYDFVNKGKSPAYNIAMDYKILRHERWDELIALTNDLKTQALAKARSWRTTVLFPGEKTDFVKPTWASFGFNHNGEKLSLICCVVYLTSNTGGTVGYDLRAFSISQNHDGAFGPRSDKLIEHGDLRQMG